MTRRQPLARQRGSEALELVAGLPLVALIVAVVLQGVLLIRQQTEAETDARVLVRAQAVCHNTKIPLLSAIDPGAPTGATASLPSSPNALHFVHTTVSIPAHIIIPGLPQSAADALTAHATVSMLSECSQ